MDRPHRDSIRSGRGSWSGSPSSCCSWFTLHLALVGCFRSSIIATTVLIVLLLLSTCSSPASGESTGRARRSLTNENVEHAPTVQHARDPVYTNSFLVKLHKRQTSDETSRLAHQLARQHGFVNLGTVCTLI